MRSVRWWVGLLVVLAAAGGLWWQLRPGEDQVWRRLQARGVFTVATDASYPPFSAVDANGALFGFDVDLAEVIGQRWGMRVEFENITYDALLPAVVAQRDDAVISAFVPQPGRLHEVAYTRPYFTAGTVLVVPAGAPDPGPEAALWAGGRRLAVEYGAGGDALARRWARQVADVTLLPLPTAAAAVQAVRAGEADGALVDALAAYEALQAGPGLRLAGPPLEPEPYVIAVDRRSQDLLKALEAALDALEQDGTLTTLRVKWFGEAAR